MSLLSNESFLNNRNIKSSQTIYFIVTTSIYNKNDIIRQNQYETCINKLIKLTNDIPNKQIIIVENNGTRNTYLDNFNVPVLYTENNFIKDSNKGNKELLDVLACIDAFNIKDTDFIVKITGRYLLDDNSDFIKKLYNLNDIECLIRYNAYFNEPVNYRMSDCVTGLIGLLCFYVKQIKLVNNDIDECDAIERKWADVTYLINLDKIYIFNTLGIYICPGNNDYFLI